MSDLSGALIALLKLKRVIDTRITLFVEISSIDPIIDFFQSLFSIEWDPESPQKTSVMIRWLLKHIPQKYTGDNRIPIIDVEKLEDGDSEELEKAVILMVICKTAESESFMELMDMLDETDRTEIDLFLNGQHCDNEYDYDSLARQIREYVHEYNTVAELKMEKAKTEQDNENRKHALTESALDIENMGMESKKKLAMDIADAKQKVAELRGELKDAPTDEARSRMELTKEMYNLEVKLEKLREKSSKLTAKVANIDELREKSKRDKKTLEELKQKAEELRAALELREPEFATKKVTFDETVLAKAEIRGLETRTQECKAILHMQLQELQTAKQELAASPKLVEIDRLKRIRDEEIVKIFGFAAQIK